MGIAYSGGTLLKNTVDGSTGTTIAADIRTRLLAAGWTDTAISGGYRMTTATTSQGLSCAVDVVVSAGNCILTAKTSDAATSLTAMTVNASGGRTYYIIANKYSFYLLLTSSTVGSSGQITAYYAGVPFLPDPVAPLVVQTATNATPIVVTTTAAHGLTSGDFVYINGVGGNTAANGFWAITVTSSTSFSLNTSVGNGAYTSGGLVGTNDRISRCIYAGGNTDGTFASSWRANPQGTAFGTVHLLVNEASYAGTTNQLQLLTSAAAPWRASRYTITEPYVYCPIVNGGTKYVQFQLWDAALVSGTPAIPLDTTMTFDSHSWQAYGVTSNCALVVAYA